MMIKYAKIENLIDKIREQQTWVIKYAKNENLSGKIYEKKLEWWNLQNDNSWVIKCAIKPNHFNITFVKNILF